MRAGRRWIAALVGCLLTAACTSTPDPAPSSPPTTTGLSAAERAWCASSIDAVAALPEEYEVVMESVGIPLGRVLQVDEAPAASTPSRFSKWGLVVRAGVAVDIDVAPGWSDKALIGWGSLATPVPAFHVPACPSRSEEHSWNVWPGGTWVTVPACVPLIIRAQGQDASVNLSVGIPCDTPIS